MRASSSESPSTRVWSVLCVLGVVIALGAGGCPDDPADPEPCAGPNADADGDGEDSIECGGLDCDDDDAARRPGAAEVCDLEGTDEDCDATTYGYRDADSDGYQDAACKNTSSDGDVYAGLDCDDARAGVHPGLLEACNEVDDDCDGAIDEGVLAAVYVDEDGDGFGRGRAMQQCTGADGVASQAGDCDDENTQIHPGAFRCAETSDDGADIDVCAEDGRFTDARCPDAGRCVPQPDGSGVCLPGEGATECSDMLDNDGDGAFDWHDAECSSPLDDSEGPRACADGTDDDGDAYVDYPNDPGCRSREDADETDPATAPACSNHLDDDGDGVADFAGGLGDPGCTSAADDSEREASGPSCDNGIDDDMSGLLDYPADSACGAPDDEELAACENGIDDDFDGIADYAKPGGDPGCDSAKDSSERASPVSNYACDNGVDDDGDGATDYPSDVDCTGPGDTLE
jgi:hypothetical protein